jgi:hypothetical protein
MSGTHVTGPHHLGRSSALQPVPCCNRVRIRDRVPNSARPPSTVSISRPCDVVVSAHASPSERKPAFLPVIAASVFNRSRVDRASRSSRVTISTSPAASWSSKRRKLRPVGLGSARHFAEHLARPVFSQCRDLGRNALSVRRYPCVAVNHRYLLRQDSAPKKRNRLNGLILGAHRRPVQGRLWVGCIRV